MAFVFKNQLWNYSFRLLIHMLIVNANQPGIIYLTAVAPKLFFFGLHFLW